MDLWVRLFLLGDLGVMAWGGAWMLRRYVGNARAPQRFDHAGEAELVTFSGPWCTDCEEIRPRLVAAATRHRVALRVIDIKESPELASKYDVRLTPTTLVVNPAGKVTASWLGIPPDGEVESALSTLVAAPLG